jgi:hypothetical protein
MNLRAWLSACATVAASGNALWGQAPIPASASPAALAAQTAVIYPSNDKAPIFTMRTAGQPDRAVRVLKMNESDAEAMAEVQDVQSGRTFSMPGKVVRAMLTGTKPAMPATVPVPTAAPAAIPAAVAAPVPAPPVASPVFQPTRIASSISERPATVAVPPREIPTVTAVATIVPTPAVYQAPAPRIEAVPETEKARLMAVVQPPAIPQPTVVEVPETAHSTTPPLPVEPKPMPVVEPVKAPAPEVTPIAKLVPNPEPATMPIAVAGPAPAQQFAAPKPVQAIAPPESKAPSLPAMPQFGTPLQTPAPATSTSMKSVPVQTWQPIRDAGTPANNSLWQPLPAPVQESSRPAATPVQSQSKPVDAKTTTVTTQCQFENHVCCPDAGVEPQVRIERTAAKCNNLGRLENQVREACQGQIYDLCTAQKPSDREDAATKLSESRFAQRPEVKAALLKAAVGDPAPSVRAHCIECLMRIGYNDIGFRAHLHGASESGAQIVQAAARTALANLPRE